MEGVVSGNQAPDQLGARLRELHESSRQYQQETSRRLKQIDENQARTCDALHELEMQILDQENAIRARG
jgi:vacuolar-type H+-ATPase subunit I/STV1